MKILCVFGQYQYGDPNRGNGIEYAAFIPALENLGHLVVHFDSWNKVLYQNYAELNQALIETVERERPDVMLTVQRDYEIWLETLLIIRARGDVAMISWTTDDSWKYKEVSRFIGSSYHAMSTTYSDCISKYHQDGIPNVLLTQWAANSSLMQEPLPFSSCKYQVSFIGAAHGDRKRRIEYLKSQGIEITCFGYGWSNGSISAEEIPKIIRDSAICLNFANAYKGVNQVKARTFEIPGAGGFLLTEHALGLERYYTIDKEIVVFHSYEELVRKIRFFLKNPSERDVIAYAGFTRTKKEHTYELRMQQLVDFALNAKLNWQEKEINLSPSYFNQVLQQHCLTYSLQSYRTIVEFLCSLVWGKQRSSRAARRLLFEISFRLFRRQTFSSSGWVGRMFPEQ